MANIIDISGKLEAVKPVLKLSETETYEINDDRKAVIKAQALMTEDIGEGENELDKMAEALTLLLGKDNVKAIEANHKGATSSVNQLRVLFIAAMAGISGDSYDTVATRFQGHQKDG